MFLLKFVCFFIVECFLVLFDDVFDWIFEICYVELCKFLIYGVGLFVCKNFYVD